MAIPKRTAIRKAGWYAFLQSAYHSLSSRNILEAARTQTWKLPPVLNALLVAAGYYAGALIGFALTLETMPVSLMWPPNAILLGALLLSPPRRWIAILLAVLPVHFVVQFQSGVPFSMAFAWFFTNCSEALLGAVAVLSFAKKKLRLDSFAEICYFVVICVVLAPFLVSFLDVTLVNLIGWKSGSYWEMWRTRFFSNMLATMAFVPVMLTWNWKAFAISGDRLRFKWTIPSMLAATFCIVGAVVLVLQISGDMEMNLHRQVLLYLPFLAILWMAVMFNPFAVSLTFLITALLATWGGAHGAGPFNTEFVLQDVLSIQIFLIGTGITMLMLSGALQERQNAHDALRRQKENLHSMLSATNVGLWDWDIVNDKVDWSPESTRIFGLESGSGSYTMKSFVDLVHPKDRKKVRKAIQRAIRNHSDCEVDYRIVTKDGKTRWVAGKGACQTDKSGKPVRMIGINVDVTDRKLAESAARQAEVVERIRLVKIQTQQEQLKHLTRTAMLGELSGALAHELNQPLTAILSNAQAARRYITKSTINIHEIREILDDIVEDDKRAAEIIRRLRTLFMKGNMKAEQFDLNLLADNTLLLFNSYLIARNISVERRLDSRMSKVNGDPVQIQQVLINLTLNACEAMENQAPEHRCIVLHSGGESGKKVWISVSDSGCGIPPAIINKIFDSFFSTKVGGMGFGLSISRTIVADHGGTIEVANNDQGGATFRVTLPAANTH